MCSTNFYLELSDYGKVRFVKKVPNTTINYGGLVLNGHGDILPLLPKFCRMDTPVHEELSADGRV